MNLEKTLAGIPGFRNLFAKFSAQDEQIRRTEYQNLLLANELIDLRLARKKTQGDPVNVVFVCHRPAVWESLHSVYDMLKADALINVSIVAIPVKKQLPGVGFQHEQYETEGAEEFWKDYPCLNGYNYETGEWLDLRTLKPDYVFFQQPYNLMFPDVYASSVVSKYAKLAYVAYFSPISIDDTYDESTPLDYLKDLTWFFTQHDDDDAFIRGRFRQIQMHLCTVINTGCPRYDRIEQYRGSECDIWNPERKFRVIWTPRWTTNEGNCHFFTYKDQFIELCDRHPEIDFVFRPHPQAFREWKATGEMNEKQQEEFRSHFGKGNMHLDESRNYYPMCFSSDCLITDRSTMIVDYFCTGKPIIYCGSRGVHDSVIPGFEKGLYKVETWEELQKTLSDLMNGKDPLKPEREAIVRDYLKIGTTKAGERIREILRADALK